MPKHGPYAAIEHARLSVPSSPLFGLTRRQAERVASFVIDMINNGCRCEEERTIAAILDENEARERKTAAKGLCSKHGRALPNDCAECRMILDLPRVPGQRGAIGPKALAKRFKRIQAGEALGPGPVRRWDPA